ncbi:hypothetical protein EFR00_19100 [Rhizobium sophoriradicis]|nr:hypothetical protein EFR00_19100 [Rhizobium sophoriradicis]
MSLQDMVCSILVVSRGEPVRERQVPARIAGFSAALEDANLRGDPTWRIVVLNFKRRTFYETVKSTTGRGEMVSLATFLEIAEAAFTKSFVPGVIAFNRAEPEVSVSIALKLLRPHMARDELWLI